MTRLARAVSAEASCCPSDNSARCVDVSVAKAHRRCFFSMLTATDLGIKQCPRGLCFIGALGTGCTAYLLECPANEAIGEAARQWQLFIRYRGRENACDGRCNGCQWGIDRSRRRVYLCGQSNFWRSVHVAERRWGGARTERLGASQR